MSLNSFQIMVCMELGVLQLANEVTTAGRWHSDSLRDVHFDDTLWGYNIHCAGILQQEKARSINDTILYCLLRIGVFNWTGMNVLGNQARQVIHWACPTIFRVLQCVWKVKKQVRPSVYILLMNTN